MTYINNNTDTTTYRIEQNNTQNSKNTSHCKQNRKKPTSNEAIILNNSKISRKNNK